METTIAYTGAFYDDKYYWERRAKEAEARLRAMELIVICANDIVSSWPKMTIRTIGSMTNRIDTLCQALKEVK